MKRRIIGLTLIVAIMCTLLSLPAMAAGEVRPGLYSWTGTWETNWGNMTLVQNGTSVTGTYEHDDGKITGTVSGNTLTGTWSESPSYSPPNDAGDVTFTMTADGKGFDGLWRYGSEGDWSEWDGGTRLTEVIANEHSWATEHLQKAYDMGLIPEGLVGANLTNPINRLEFAAVCVKVYENLAGTKALPAVVNPFKDTNDIEVLKALNVGITSGYGSDDIFAPTVILTREQAAAMLTRVFKRVTIPGWTLATDSSYTLNYTKPALFADDAKISDWAKPSVYFMAAHNIIGGIGNNTFAPKNITTAEEASNYASATREQALIIAVNMVVNLTGVTADYTKK